MRTLFISFLVAALAWLIQQGPSPFEEPLCYVGVLIVLPIIGARMAASLRAAPYLGALAAGLLIGPMGLLSDRALAGLAPFEDLALARYRRDAGLPRDVLPRDVYEQYADLFQPEVLDLLASESQTDREERALVHALRRRLVFLRLDRSVHPIWAKVRNKERETKLRLGEEEIPFLEAERAIALNPNNAFIVCLGPL